MKMNIHQPPHIMPGKYLKAKDFEEIYSWFRASVANNMRVYLANDRYGLLYTRDNKLPFDPDLQGNLFRLKSMAGITKSGKLICQIDQVSPELKLDLTSFRDKKLHIYIIAEINSRPGTISNGSNTPQGYLYSFPLYRLEAKPQREGLPETYPDALKIAEVDFVEGKPILGSYIPPCAHLGAHDKLWSAYLRYAKYWRDFYQLSQHIERGTVNQETRDLHKIAGKIGDYLAANQSRFQHLNQTSTPIELYYLISGIANIFWYQWQISDQKNGLLRTFEKYTHSTPGYRFQFQGFQDAIHQLVEYQYIHSKGQELIKKMDTFFDYAWPVWRRLGEAGWIAPPQMDAPNVLIG